MATIYVSYKLEDRGLAAGLSKKLEGLGHRAVYDAVALLPGTDWRQVLLNELTKADVLVVLLTEHSLGSPFVMGEIGSARVLNHLFGQMLIVPVLIEGMDVPPVVSDLFVIRMSADEEGLAHAASEINGAIENYLAHSRSGYPKIFISHRHRDAAIAEALVRVIEAAFDVAPSDLRCTSVYPYKLRAGDRTSDRLRAEIGRAEAVLGILTPDTKASSYVLFELGASWGRRGVTFPLLARGASLADVPAPIGDLHTLSLEDGAECHQLVDDLADVTTLRRQEKQGALVSQRIAELVALAHPDATGDAR